LSGNIGLAADVTRWADAKSSGSLGKSPAATSSMCPRRRKALRVVSGFNDRMQDHALAQPQRQWIFRIDLSGQNAPALPMEHLDFPRI
jgi:hypothetical protein